MATVAWMPLGMPRPRTSAAVRVMRAAYSCTREPPKTRWVWLSTKPGATTQPVASSTLGRGQVDLRPQPRPRADRQDALAGDGDGAVRRCGRCESPVSPADAGQDQPALHQKIGPQAGDR